MVKKASLFYRIELLFFVKLFIHLHPLC